MRVMPVKPQAPCMRQPVARFGWSQKAPPSNYTLHLSRDDYDQQRHPTPGFIQKIAPYLIRQEHLELPGFLLIPNLNQHIPSHQVNRFLEKVVIALRQHLTQTYATVFNLHKVPLTIIKKRQVDGQIAQEGNLHNADTQGKWTLKSPHFDRNALMVLHRYEPTENLQNGNLQVMDLKQFLHDHPSETLSDMLNPDKTIKKEFWARLEPYKLTLKTNSPEHNIVFLNNIPENGIAHGVTPLEVMDGSQPFKRIFERYTITPYEPRKTLPPDVTRIDESA